MSNNGVGGSQPPKSPMVRLYEPCDPELKTRLDEGGTVRVDHTRTSAANRVAARGKKELISDLKDELKSLQEQAKSPAIKGNPEARKAHRAKIGEVRQQLHQLRSEVTQDQFEAGYHGFLSKVNQLIGRE